MTPTRATHHHDDHLYDESELHNEDVAHEHSDVNVRALLIFAFGLMAVVAACAAAMYGLFNVLESQAASNDPVMSPLSRPAGQLPPEPRLLTDEPQNLQHYRAQQTESLQGIEAAKKQLLQQGLPVRVDAPTDRWMGTYSASRGESSSGRMIPTKPGDLAAGPVGLNPVPPPAAAAPAPPKSGGH
jgi:hypothetical protein